jgi:hypothetical protein
MVLMAIATTVATSPILYAIMPSMVGNAAGFQPTDVGSAGAAS